MPIPSAMMTVEPLPVSEGIVISFSPGGIVFEGAAATVLGRGISLAAGFGRVWGGLGGVADLSGAGEGWIGTRRPLLSRIVGSLRAI